MNPIAVVTGYYTSSIKVFALVAVLGYLLVTQMGQIRKRANAGASLAQAEFMAVQREGERRLRNQKMKAAKEFTEKLVTNLKAMKKEHPKEKSGKGEKMEIDEAVKVKKLL